LLDFLERSTAEFYGEIEVIASIDLISYFTLNNAKTILPGAISSLTDVRQQLMIDIVI